MPNLPACNLDKSIGPIRGFFGHAILDISEILGIGGSVEEIYLSIDVVSMNIYLGRNHVEDPFDGQYTYGVRNILTPVLIRHYLNYE